MLTGGQESNRIWGIPGKYAYAGTQIMIWPHLNCHVLVSPSQKKDTGYRTVKSSEKSNTDAQRYGIASISEIKQGLVSKQGPSAWKRDNAKRIR